MNRAHLLAAGLACVALTGAPMRVPATPLADVPANHWAYQAIASLAADGLIDGYPDGSFKGDRPLTRYEMATIVARVIAKLEAAGAGTASKTDLDKLQKLIDALKDELDALGVRVTSLEDAVASLDRRTRVAQAISVHGTVLGNGSTSAFAASPHSIVNGTGAPQTPYYAPAPVPNGAVTGIDQFVNVYATAPDDNNPLEAWSGPQTILRSDARFDFIYTASENVTVSIPLHVIDYGSGSPSGQQFSVSPDVVVDVAQAGAFTNLTLRDAQLDNVASSRLGLTYRAPDAAQQNDFANPTQPFPRGFEIGGIFAGLTSFQLTFSRVDQTLLNTQSFLSGPSGSGFANGYLAPVVPPQGGLVQAGSTPTTDTFTAGSAGLGGVYLSKKAVAGTVVITSYAPPGGAAPPPAFSYLDGTNEVVFAIPLPPGARVAISYVGLGYTNNQIPQRYQAGLRINQQFAGLPGAEAGLTFHRLWDQNLPQGTEPGAVDLGVNAPPAGDFGAVSDTVFGLDFQVPLAFVRGRDADATPILFGEASASRWTPDVQFVAPTGAYAAVAGLKLTLHRTHVTLQYQSIGANYLDGAPLRFFGNAPPTWANYQGDFFPQFFGFANTLGINQTFDASVNAGVPGRSATAANPALTFIYPIFNPFVAGGPGFYSAFAPNTQGPSLTILSPLRLGGVTIEGRLFAQHLGQLQANANATGTFGPQFSTGVRATFDKLDAGATIPLGHVSVNLSGTLEHLERNDTTGQRYIPYNPANAGYDPGALANFQAAAGSSAVVYYPNYINMYHTLLAAGASLPVTRDVVLNTRYSDQRYFGSYGTTLQPNIGGIKDQVDLGLTYTVPNTSSSVGLGFHNSTYKDAALSSYDLTANRADVNFTIRF
ncbi:MAG TPA: S-layer homology domain-containing protein [Candidatus Lustribacter sp.]